MTSCRYWPVALAPAPESRHPATAGCAAAAGGVRALDGRVVEHPLDQSARSDHVVERADRPVEPEMDAGDGRCPQGVEMGQGRQPIAHASGIRPRTRSNGTASTTKSAAMRLARAQVHAAHRAIVIELDRADARRQTDGDVVVAQPALQPSSVELAQRNQGNLRLKPRPVPQEPVEENLASVADVHLLEPLVQGRDEHGCPEQVDRARALPVSQQPVGKRLARPVIARAGQTRQAVSHAHLVGKH